MNQQQLSDIRFAIFQAEQAERQRLHDIHRAWLKTDEGREFIYDNLLNSPDCQQWREKPFNLARATGRKDFLAWAELTHSERMGIDAKYFDRAMAFRSGIIDPWLRKKISLALVKIRSQSKAKGYQPCLADREEIYAAYDGRCKLCNVPDGIKTLVLHHNHDNGRFAGWLCRQCNTFIG